MTDKERAIMLSRLATAAGEVMSVIYALHAKAPGSEEHGNACRALTEINRTRESLGWKPGAGVAA